MESKQQQTQLWRDAQRKRLARAKQLATTEVAAAIANGEIMADEAAIYLASWTRWHLVREYNKPREFDANRHE